jgi:hypothetical protein
MHDERKVTGTVAQAADIAARAVEKNIRRVVFGSEDELPMSLERLMSGVIDRIAIESATPAVEEEIADLTR